MKPKAQAVLKLFLNSSNHRDELLRFLPAALAEEVQGLTINQDFENLPFFNISSWFLPIHYSWFCETIQDFPPYVQTLFINSLTPAHHEGLRKMLSLSENKKNISPFLRCFLINILKKSLKDPDLLVEQLLPPSPLNILLGLPRQHLIHLANLLGLHDLSADLRQVVDKELLRKIQHALTTDQLHFLHYCSKQPIKWVPPKLGLLAWDGSQKHLNHLVQYRGLIRLAKAIVQEHPSFKWHLLHHLDIGRAKVIQKEFYRKQDPSLLSYFKNQVLHIAKRYQK